MKFTIQYHAGNPQLCRIPELKIGVMPECEGGGWYMPREQAEMIAASYPWDRIRKLEYDNNQAAARIRRLESDHDALVNALQFYANPCRYQGPNQRPLEDDPHAKPDQVYIQDVSRDNGEIARNALRYVKQNRSAP